MNFRRILISILFSGCSQSQSPDTGAQIFIERIQISERGARIDLRATVRNGSNQTPFFVVSNEQYMRYDDDRDTLLFVFSDQLSSGDDYEAPESPGGQGIALSDHHTAHLSLVPPGGTVELATVSFDRRIRLAFYRRARCDSVGVDDFRKIEFRVAFLTQPFSPLPSEGRYDRRRRFMSDAWVASTIIAADFRPQPLFQEQDLRMRGGSVVPLADELPPLGRVELGLPRLATH